MLTCVSVTVAHRLRVAREARGLNQRDLAEKAGLSVAYVHKVERTLDPGMERDAIANPRLDCVEKLAAALDVPIQWLALGIGPEPTWKAPGEGGSGAAA